MTDSFRALFEQLGSLAEPRPAEAPDHGPEVPDFGALAGLLEPAPHRARVAPAFGTLAELLTAAPAVVSVGEKPIVFIACSDMKIDTKGRAIPAADLYSSAL